MFYLKRASMVKCSLQLFKTVATNLPLHPLGSQAGTVAARTFVAYVQGQSPEPRVREYFYYIDHQGMLFLDDSRMKNFTSCFKVVDGIATSVEKLTRNPTSARSHLPITRFNLWLDSHRNNRFKIQAHNKKFLAFFFKRLRKNETSRYAADFPYLSLCGRERNFVRCDDLPIVFTHVIPKELNVQSATVENLFSYAHAGELLTVPFEPASIFMSMESGRVYHPAPEIAGGIGLVRSKLAIEFSKFFEFGNGEDQSPTHFSWEGQKYELKADWYTKRSSTSP